MPEPTPDLAAIVRRRMRQLAEAVTGHEYSEISWHSIRLAREVNAALERTAELERALGEWVEAREAAHRYAEKGDDLDAWEDAQVRLMYAADALALLARSAEKEGSERG